MTGRPVASEPNSEAQDVVINNPGPEGEHNPSESSSAGAGADVASLVPALPKAVKTLLEGDLMVYLEEVLQFPCFDLFIGHVGAILVRTDRWCKSPTDSRAICVFPCRFWALAVAEPGAWQDGMQGCRWRSRSSCGPSQGTTCSGRWQSCAPSPTRTWSGTTRTLLTPPTTTWSWSDATAVWSRRCWFGARETSLGPWWRARLGLQLQCAWLWPWVWWRAW